ncbi:MAG: hypothetical protein ACFCVG_09015, partial [Kineosporiaceae bacterium]
GGAVAGAAPAGAAPAGAAPEPSGTVTLVLRDVVLRGIEISGAEDPDSGPDGGAVPVVRLEIATLAGASALTLDRPLPDGSLRIAAGTGGSGVAAAGGVRLDAARACVRGLGITELGLLRGVLDGPLNEAFAVDPEAGFQPTWATWLANAVGSTDVAIVVEELRADVGSLEAPGLQLTGARLVRDGEPAGGAGCGDVPGTAAVPLDAGSGPDTPEEVAAQLREAEAVPEGMSVPELLGEGGSGTGAGRDG